MNGTPLGWLALVCALLPVAVVHLCYIVSVQGGQIPGCIPYFSGCTSVSAAGRYGAAYFLFKAGMIPAAVALATYWVLCRRWLLTLGYTEDIGLRSMAWLGVIAALFLILYAVFLGSKGDFYDLMRRFGVTVYFAGSALAQILLLRGLRRINAQGIAALPGPILTGKLIVVSALLALGLISIPLGNFMPDKDRAQNVVEWWFGLLMVSYYALTWFAWRQTRFRVDFSVTPAAQASRIRPEYRG